MPKKPKSKSYVQIGSTIINVPPKMIGFDSQHHKHLYNTTTPNHNIAIHNGKPAIKFVRNIKSTRKISRVPFSTKYTTLDEPKKPRQPRLPRQPRQPQAQAPIVMALPPPPPPPPPPRPQIQIMQQRVVAPLVIQQQLQIPRPIPMPRPQIPVAFQQRVVAPVVIPQQPRIIAPPARPQMPIAQPPPPPIPVPIPAPTNTQVATNEIFKRKQLLEKVQKAYDMRNLPNRVKYEGKPEDFAADNKAYTKKLLKIKLEQIKELRINREIVEKYLKGFEKRAIKEKMRIIGNKQWRKDLEKLAARNKMFEKRMNKEDIEKQALVKSLNDTQQQQKLNVLAMAASEPSFVNPIPNPTKIQRLFRKIKARRERRELLSLVEPLDINMPPEKSDILSIAISQPSFDVSKVLKEDIKAKRKVKKDAIKLDKAMTKSEERLARETLKQLDTEREEERRIVEHEERLRIANEEYKVLREKQKQEKEVLLAELIAKSQERLLNDTSSDVIKRAIAKKAAKEKGKKLLIELKIKQEKEKQAKENAIDVIKRNIEHKVMRNKAKKELNELKLKNQEKQMVLKIATSSDIIKRAITKNALKTKGRKQLEELKIKQQQEKDELIRKQEEERLKIQASSDIIKRAVAMKALKSKGKKQLQELKIKQQQEKEKIMGNAIDIIKGTFERNALRSKINTTINEIKIKDQEQKELLELQTKQYKIAKKQEIINKSKELKKLKKQQPIDFKFSNLIKLSKSDAKKMGLEDGKTWFEDEDTSADYVQMNINRFQKQLNKINDKLKTDLTIEEEKWTKNKQIYLSSIISVFKDRIGNLKTNAEVKQEKLKKLDEDIDKSEEKIKLIEYVAKISAKNNVEEEMSLSMSISDAELYYENAVKEFHNYRDDERNEKIFAKPIVSVLTDDAYRKVIEKMKYYSKKLDYIRKFIREIEEQDDLEEDQQEEEEDQQEEEVREYTKEEVDSWSFEKVKKWLRDQGYYDDDGSLRATIKGVDPDTDRYAYNAYQRFKRKI